MRGDTVRAAIAALVTATTLDATTTPADVLTYFDVGAGLPDAMRGRSFAVRLVTTPVRSNTLFPTDLYVATWDVDIFYGNARNVLDRIALDCERVSQKLETMPSAYADVAQIRVVGGPVQEVENVVTATITCEVEYRLDAGV